MNGDQWHEEVKDDAQPFRGGRLDAAMAWRGGKSLADLEGRSVRVLFALRNAELYSFWFK